MRKASLTLSLIQFVLNEMKVIREKVCKTRGAIPAFCRLTYTQQKWKKVIIESFAFCTHESTVTVVSYLIDNFLFK